MCLVIPEKYETSLGIIETQQAIKDLKDFFENRLGEMLKLTRVSSPLFVLPETISGAIKLGVPNTNVDPKLGVTLSLSKIKTSPVLGLNDTLVFDMSL